MKEAATLLLMLLLGWFASQASHAFGLNLTQPDTNVTNILYIQIDDIYQKNPSRLATIAGKLPSIKRAYSSNPADEQLLEDLEAYIDYKLNAPSEQPIDNAIVLALSDLFN